MARAFRRKGQRYVAKFDEMERGVVAGLLEQTRDIVAPTEAGEPPVANPDAFDDIVAGVSVGAEDHVASSEELELDVPWITLVWNDPVNLMSYVTYVFETYFGYPRHKAEKLMLDVHSKGKAVVAHGSREEMERDTEAMHGFGLWATFEKDA